MYIIDVCARKQVFVNNVNPLFPYLFNESYIIFVSAQP